MEKNKAAEKTLCPLDEAVFQAVQEKEDTIYGVADRLKIAWNTARVHLGYLREMGLVDFRSDPWSVGQFKDKWYSKVKV